MTQSLRQREFGSQRGFTLVELLIVVAIIGILSSIAIPLFNNMQTRARVAKGQADVRALATAVSVYLAHYGSVPTALGEMTVSGVNNQGTTAGPVIAAIPTTPVGWTPSNAIYTYVTGAGETFTISATGDFTTAKVP